MRFCQGRQLRTCKPYGCCQATLADKHVELLPPQLEAQVRLCTEYAGVELLNRCFHLMHSESQIRFKCAQAARVARLGH